MQTYPQTGWVEQNPVEIWQTQRATAREALAKSELTASDIAALGITNQRETTVVWDRRTGEPIHNAIVWQDRRTAGFCDQLKLAGYGELIQRKTGLVLDAYFSGSKLRRLLDNVTGARARAQAAELGFGTIDTWLLWNVSAGGLHLTDTSHASRTMLFNLHSGQWDDELLGILDVPREVLPEIRSSSEVDQYARGTITGLTRGTTTGHLARAALEGIAFQVANVLEVMNLDSGIPINELRIDGGASANNLLAQFQADILQPPVVRPKVIETNALGAAYLAGLATGFWKDRVEMQRAWQASAALNRA